MKKFLKDISVSAKVQDPFAIVETKGMAVSPNEIFPGHLYYLGIDPGFQITPDVIPLNLQEYQENKGKKINITKKPYYDTMPIGIALNLNNENYKSILNLKLIPPNYKRLILDSYYNIMEIKNEFIGKYIKEDLSKIEVPIGERIRNTSYLQPFLAVTESFMKQVVRADVGFAIKNYEINSIKNVRLLDWNALPDVYNMAITDRGMTFNSQIGGVQEVFSMFESKFF